MDSAGSITCPNCSAEVPVSGGHVAVVACNFCQGTLLLGQDQIQYLGKSSTLKATKSCLSLGWPAVLRGKEVYATGRLQYQYSKGVWDEWFVRDDTGQGYWISQDEGIYMLESTSGVSPDQLPYHSQLKPGQGVRIGQQDYMVEEKDTAILVGAAGELPEKVIPGEEMIYVDLGADGLKATLTYFPDGSVEFYQGQYLDFDELDAVPGGGATPLKRFVQVDAAPVPRSQASGVGKALNCVQCNASLNVFDPLEAKMVVCSHCGYGQALDAGTLKMLADWSGSKVSFPIEIGATCKLKGVDYTVIGRVHYIQYDEGEYRWDELQLYSENKGYVFLGCENGHWTLFKKCKSSSNFTKINPGNLSPKTSIGAYGQTYKVFESGGVCEVGYVEGELTWVCSKGDESAFMDAIRPPHVLSAEWTSTEMEWYHGQYLARGTVAKAFGKKVKDLPPMYGTAPAQPFDRSTGQKARMNIGFGFSAALLCLFLWSSCHSGDQTLRERFDLRRIASSKGAISKTFVIPEGEHIMEMDVFARNDNSWVNVGIAFVDENDDVDFDAEAVMESYSGYTDGEHWSEGSDSDSTLFKLKGPKKYRLNIFGEGGMWPSGYVKKSGVVDVTLSQGAIPSRYFLLALIVVLIYPVKELVRQITFESTRWPSEDDD